MSTSIAVDINRSRMLSKVAKKHNSQALEADALHFSTDVWSSAVVIGGLFFVYLSESLQIPWLAQADAIAAIGVAGIVMYVSIQLGRRAIASMIDEVSPMILVKIAEAAHVPGVQDEKDNCLNRLEALFQNRKGILHAHLEREKSPVNLFQYWSFPGGANP